MKIAKERTEVRMKVLTKITREELMLIINAAVLVLILVAGIVNRISARRTKKNFKKLLGEIKKDGVVDMLKECSTSNNILKEKIDYINCKISEIDKIQNLTIKKVGIIRYNPFKNMGSDLSFSLALLNNYDDGIIVSSLYSRENSFVYAKPIKNGNSEYKLSNEEEAALDIAKNNYSEGMKVSN